MKRPALLAVCAAALLPAVFSCSSGQELHEIDARILGLIDRYGLPSMGAVVVTHGERSYLNALGLRSKGSNTAVTAGDAFHIGSNTKSMTAVLAAVTVQNGWISWDDTIGGIIGEEVEVGTVRTATSPWPSC
ncbi:MAG: serine hydrolase [Spirochaetota bacterium]